MDMTPEAERIMEELDAALFSGGTFFSTEAVTVLRENIERWTQRIDEIADILNS